MTRSEVLEACVRLKNVVPLARLSNPKTSAVAAQTVAKCSDAQCVSVMYALLAAEPFGMTYYEVEKKLGMRSAKQRVSDLKRVKLIEPTGETRVAYATSAEVYRPTADVVYYVVGGVQPRLL
jgi:hypothetical protein